MILFIDDEERRMKSYVQELEFSNYNVEFKPDVDSALECLENPKEEIELIILDIMMPTGKKFFNNSQAEKGLRSGICLYQEIRKQKPMLPIVIFTNVYDKKLLQDIDKDDRTSFCEKGNFFLLN